jgi:hypothetical protein
MSISYQSLLDALEACKKDSEQAPLTLGTAFDRLQESSFSFVCLLLALPFLQPVSLGPLSSIGGLTFAALGWQLARGREIPWLPDSVKKISLGKTTWSVLIRILSGVVRFCHRFTRPRLQTLVSGLKGDTIIGWIIIVAGLLMAIPFFGLPFNNTLPALAIVAVCIAELEDDGGFVIVSLALLVLTVVYFSFIAYAILGGMNYVLEYFGMTELIGGAAPK